MVQDPWLQSSRTFRLMTLFVFLHGFFWRGELIDSLFCPRDIELILKIRLSKDGEIYKLIWHYTPKGLFTVSYAYTLAMQLDSGSMVTRDWCLVCKCNISLRGLKCLLGSYVMGLWPLKLILFDHIFMTMLLVSCCYGIFGM